MDIEARLQDLGVDAITGVRLMQLIGVYPSEFFDESRFMQFKDVIDFFKDKPDLEFLINKITAGKNVDRLTHVWGYCELTKQKVEKSKQLDVLNDRKKTLEVMNLESNEFALAEIENEINETNINIGHLSDQMFSYEK